MKKFGLVLAFIAGLLVLGGVVVVMMLSDVTKALIEKLGSEALGVPVSIASLDIRLTEQSVAVRGIRIGNPKGYEGGDLLKLAAIDVSLGDVSKQLVTFSNIRVSGSEINLKVSEKGTNFGALKENIAKNGSDDASAKSEATSSKVASTSEAPKVIIDKFLFEKTTINPTVTLLGSESVSSSVSIPDIKLNDIGKKENGVLVKEALSQIFSHISSKVEKVAFEGGLLKGMNVDVLKSFGGNVLQNVKDAVPSEDKLKDAAKGLLGAFGQ